jgi:hypothetical protein
MTSTTSPRTLEAIARHGAELATARAATRAARDALRPLVARAVARGTTEAEVARLAGVDRMTVREWAGKTPSAFHPKPKA